MQEMLNQLPEDEFIRVHKSYIISLSHIDSISGNRIKLKGEEIPVGETYKMELRWKINPK
jgi:DNA-binding LytR/AlgR family response regulator